MPTTMDSLIEEMSWLLNLAVRLEYTDNRTVFFRLIYK